MTAGYVGDTCVCGRFKYAGHRCPPSPMPVPSETARLRAQQDELRDVMATVARSYDLVPCEKAVLERLADAEQGRITAQLTELEGGGDDDA